MFKAVSCLALLALTPRTLAAQEAAAVTKFGRTSMAIGGGFMSGAYEVSTDSGDTRLWYVTHQTILYSGVAEIRHEVVRGWDVGFRFIASNGFDRSSKPKRVFLSGFTPPRSFGRGDTARKDDMHGLTYLMSVDTRYMGVTGGVATGRWFYPSDYPITTVPEERSVPMGALRVGRLNNWHVEAGYGRQLAALAPRPVVQAGLARGNIDGTRLIRFGLTKEGGYVGGRLVTDYGLDIEPYFAARSPAGRQFGIVVKERVRLMT